MSADQSSDTIVARLRHSITTACNDDHTEIGTEKRARHSARIDAIYDAIEFIESNVPIAPPFHVCGECGQAIRPTKGASTSGKTEV